MVIDREDPMTSCVEGLGMWQVCNKTGGCCRCYCLYLTLPSRSALPSPTTPASTVNTVPASS